MYLIAFHIYLLFFEFWFHEIFVSYLELLVGVVWLSDLLLFEFVVVLFGGEELLDKDNLDNGRICVEIPSTMLLLEDVSWGFFGVFGNSTRLRSASFIIVISPEMGKRNFKFGIQLFYTYYNYLFWIMHQLPRWVRYPKEKIVPNYPPTHVPMYIHWNSWLFLLAYLHYLVKISSYPACESSFKM